MEMIRLLILLFLHAFVNANCAFAQTPLQKMWDARFGGDDYEVFTTVLQTSDGGYILGGFTTSNSSGDKTQNSWGGFDYWVVKTDSAGNKLWDKNFGGSFDDRLFTVHQTSDGGYILGGCSFSNASGDKTQNTWGYYDYWIVKTDSLGNKLWDKDFGGTDDDYFYSMTPTSDGGYILGGYSYSNTSGDKSQDTWGETDYWIVKTDSIGNKQWDRNFGGTDFDNLFSMKQTTDGGYILGGFSRSDSGGTKTQNSWGTNDYWIIKTDSLGNVLWDRDFGGTDYEILTSIDQTTDGGFILAGYSDSDMGGDKSQNSWGYDDYWIIKTDSMGNKIWDKDFGATDIEWLYSVKQTGDGGYLLAGQSSSNTGGDKTEDNVGQMQTWIIKTDSQGNKQWDKTIFTTGIDLQGVSIETPEVCYIVASSSDGNIGGYKTQASWNNSRDYWIVKFCDSTLWSSLPERSFQEESSIVYPNPVHDQFTVQNAESRIESVTLYDAIGCIVNIPFNNHRRTADCRLLRPGIYFLEITVGQKIYRQKLIKQ